jgi:stage V sporulation protein SpoVS
MFWLLTRALARSHNTSAERRFADAVAVAGIASMLHPRRRAVVAVLSSALDQSHYSPAVVRRYLDDIGVPLFVWSAAGPRPDVVSTWGAVDDISTEGGLSLATAKLSAAIVEQRIAWVATDPLSALDVEGQSRCGLTPVAHAR